LVVWDSLEEDDSLSGVFGQFLDKNGNKIGIEFQINSSTLGIQSDTNIDSNGTSYLISWRSLKQNNSSLFSQLYDHNGNRLSNELEIYTGDSIHSQGTQSIGNDGENYFITWSAKIKCIYGQMITNKGNKIGQRLTISRNGRYESLYLSLTSIGSKSFVAWHMVGGNLVMRDNIYGSIIQWGYGSNPLSKDSDNDGLEDNDEVNIYGTNLTDPDSDNDGLNDFDELFVYSTNHLDDDTDNDGLIDGDEINHQSNAFNPDSDNDGMPDGWEVANNLNLLDNDAEQDKDNDALTNLEEYGNGTKADNRDTDNDGLTDGDEIKNRGSSPINPDTDNDGMLDGWEIENNLNLLVNDTVQDKDNDDLTNLEEYRYGTKADNRDTDNDGLLDGEEISTIRQEILQHLSSHHYLDRQKYHRVKDLIRFRLPIHRAFHHYRYLH